MPPFPLILAAALWLSSTAHAYVDPGAGRVLIQLLLGGATGLTFLVGLYGKKLLAFLRRRKPAAQAEPETHAGSRKRQSS